MGGETTRGRHLSLVRGPPGLAGSTHGDRLAALSWASRMVDPEDPEQRGFLTALFDLYVINHRFHLAQEQTA